MKLYFSKILTPFFRRLSHEKLAQFCVLTTLIYVSLFEFKRLRYGVDFQDEAYYIALPYSLILGAKAFLNEYSLHQTAGFIVYPFIKLYTSFFGVNGIVLFVRYLFYFLALTVGIYAGQIAGKKLSIVWRLAIVSIVWLFWPFSIPSLSYNTLCSLLFLAATFSAGLTFVNSGSLDPFKMSVSGIFLALSILSYPTMIVPAAVFIVILIWTHNQIESKTPQLPYFFLGSFFGVSMLILFLFSTFGWTNILNCIQYVRSFGIQGGGISKLIAVLKPIATESNVPHLVWFLPMIGGALIFFRKYCGFLAPILIAGISWLQIAKGPLYLPTYLALLAPIFVWMNRDDLLLRRLFFLIWIPSMIAGILTGFTSGNGFANMMLGCLPGAVFSIFASCLAIKKIPVLQEIRPWLMAVTVIAPMIACVNFTSLSVYAESAPPQLLTSRIESGPYSAMFTSAQKAHFIYELNRDVHRFFKNKKTALFYDDFPAGYLFSNLLPVGPGVWFYSNKLQNPNIRLEYVNYFEKSENKPDIVVELKDSRWNFYEGNPHIKVDPLTQLFKKLGYQMLSETETYWIWGKPGA